LLVQGPGRLAAGALVVLTCLGACARTPVDETAAGTGPHRYGWMTKPPGGCGLGGSGPTLDPGDALRKARLRALEQLAAAELGVHVDSELYIDSRSAIEITELDVDGVMADSRIVAMASARANAPGRMQEVLALACRADATPPNLPPAPFPAWLLEPPIEAGRVCVTGVGGPTWSPDDQTEAALRDGRTALALAIEARIRQTSLDTGHGRIRVASASSATERGRRAADAVDTLVLAWHDASGEGPLGLPGVLYGLVCADAPR
jgi:hypothetical protein